MRQIIFALLFSLLWLS